MIRKVAKFGWRPDLPDKRDWRLSLPAIVREGLLPTSVDLRPQCPPVVDQGDLGSCTANALACALLFAGMQQGKAPVELSRLFIYYNERVLEGSVNEDGGAELRDGIKSVAKLGACLELAWPYWISRYADKPSDVAYYDAAQRKAIQYLRVGQSELALRHCLADGYPVVFGFSVYESFESVAAQAGNVPMPARHEMVIGGHAVVLVGYQHDHRLWLVRNSWGSDWGQQGYFTMPYDYLVDPDLADDFWTIRKVS